MALTSRDRLMGSAPYVTAPSAPQHPTFSELVVLLREDRAANLREWSSPGFQALLAYRLARYQRGLGSRPSQLVFGVISKRLQHRAARRYGIRIHHSAVIGRRVRLIHQSAISIQAGSVIGDDCWLRQGVTLGSITTPPAGSPTLGRDVRLGANVVIEGGCTIGDSVRIGPNSVVIADVPEGASVMPARSRRRG
jgi:serine O-acetyltransferase